MTVVVKRMAKPWFRGGKQNLSKDWIERGMMEKIELVDSNTLRTDLTELKVGRDTANDIILDDQSVSMNHAVIYKAGLPLFKKWFVKDLASKNKTRIIRAGSEQEVDPAKPAALQNGDKLCFGDAMLAFTF